MNEPPPRRDGSGRRDDPGRRDSGPRGAPPRHGLSTRAKVATGVFIAVLYTIGMSLRGAVLPGVVGGVLAGILCFLVLREIEQRRDRRGP